MSRHRWKLIEEQVDLILDLPEEKRQTQLDMLKKGNGELFEEVSRFLAAIHKSEGFLKRKTIPWADDFFREFVSDAGGKYEQASIEGKQAGSYTIIKRLGHGGMGTVYLARRTDGTFDREVAIKFIRSELHHPPAVKQFERERQILASLNHPSIAALYDGGQDEHGSPYLVMEYIEGQSLIDYAREKRLTLREKLELFMRICDAVHHAHQNLIIHRDLKPSNILVKGSGEVKLLDFGVARLIEKVEPDAPATRSEFRFITTGYASPEQVNGETVTTASDVYSLGVVLYEMLSGTLPHDTATLAAAQAAKVIGEEKALKPSTKLRRSAHLIRENLSGSDLNKLIRSLQGDLDTIILKAMQKEPGLRFSSARALADDIRRYLNREPIEAASPGFIYRARKFLRRHARASAIIFLSATMLLSGLIYHNRLLEAERDAARHEAAKAEQISSYLIQLFESADPSRAMGREISARELLDMGMTNLEALGGQPEIQAELTGIMGKVFFSLGMLDEADDLLARAIELNRTLHGEMSLQLAAALANYGLVAGTKGDHSGQLQYQQQALNIRRAHLRGNHPLLASSSHNMASALRVLDRYDEAFMHSNESLLMRLALHGEMNEDVANSYNQLGSLHYNAGKFADAESSWRKALAIQEQVLGDHHPKTLVTAANLSTVLRRKTEFDEAAQILLDVLEKRAYVLGDEHPDYANTLYSLGFLYYDMGAFDEAEHYWRQTLEKRIALYGNEHPDIGTTLNALAALARGKGDFEETLVILNELLEYYRTVYGREHGTVARMLHNLGATYASLEQGQVAAQYYREALEMRIRILGRDHPDVAWVHHNLATVLIDFSNDYDQAAIHAEEAFRIRLHALGSDHELTLESRHLLDEAGGNEEIR